MPKVELFQALLEAAPDGIIAVDRLGQLAGGVAHDFNNLLAVIINYTSFISEEVSKAAAQPGGRQWEQVCRDVEQVQLAAERAIELAHQLLEFESH